MKTIDLDRIIESQHLDHKETAKMLFPEAKYPSLALNRVRKGEAQLNAQQISKLSAMTGLSVDDLFSNKGWKNKAVNGSEHTFENGEYVAVLNTETFKARIYFKDSLFHDELILEKSITLSSFFETLENLIKSK